MRLYASFPWGIYSNESIVVIFQETGYMSCRAPNKSQEVKSPGVEKWLNGELKDSQGESFYSLAFLGHRDLASICEKSFFWNEATLWV